MRARRRARGPILLLVAALAGCAAPRVLPVPAPGVAVDAAAHRATVAAPGLELIVRSSMWTAAPPDLPDYVTPFHVQLANASALPLRYDYAGLLLFDDARFQYTALPPAEVARMLGARGEGGPLLAAGAQVGTRPSARRWRGDFSWPYWRAPWWGPWGPFYDPWPPSFYYFYAPRLAAVLGQALAVGTLDPAARQEGFVYFPRLRPAATRLSFEFRYRLGDVPGVLAVPFAVERAARRGAAPVS